MEGIRPCFKSTKVKKPSNFLPWETTGRCRIELIFINSIASPIDAFAVMVIGSGIINEWIFMTGYPLLK
jgi:hypothetical protein